MKNSFLALLLLVLFGCSSSKKITASKNNKGDLIGYANKASFSEAPFAKWFQSNYNKYNPDNQIISSLKEKLKGVKIKGFMGTWCGDSRRETPSFYKILEQANYNLKNVELVTVNRSRKTPDKLHKGFNIIRVPTFIFYKNGKELGRFVEYPIETLEKDMLKIVSGVPYKHAYEK